jgi:hypothetical protein
VRATLIGSEARGTLDAGGDGTVLAWFPLACYAELPGGLLALVAPEVHPGPTHVVLDRAMPRVEPGTPARQADDGIEVGGHRAGFEAAAPWLGELPPAGDVRATARVVIQAGEPESARSALLLEPYRSIASRSRDALSAGDLRGAAEGLVGLGPGLTPAGDDALAGLIFSKVAVDPGSARELAELAELGDTGPIPRATLRSAARGQALAPAHDLVMAGAAHDEPGAARAAAALARVGETSGADFLLGVVWGLETL